jgi:hypothetical protein
MSELNFTAKERERSGVLINNISFYATQLIQQTATDLTAKALANLAKVKEEDEDLLKRLDELARVHGEESPLRLIEDLTRVPTDAVQIFTMIRRCMLVCAYLGRCIAQPSNPGANSPSVESHTRVH